MLISMAAAQHPSSAPGRRPPIIITQSTRGTASDDVKLSSPDCVRKIIYTFFLKISGKVKFLPFALGIFITVCVVK